METADTSRLPDELFWLRDAPLFIDRNQVSRFYDALIRPEYDTESIRSSVTEQTARTLAGLLKLSGTAGAEVTIDPGIIANLLSSFFKAEAKATAEASAEAEGNVGRTATKGSGREVVLRPITTPERSLEQLTLHYLLQHPERLFLVADPSEPDWRTPSVVSAVPREVVFLDLPSYSEAGTDRPQTKIIPTAAEFEDGAIVPLFLEFRDKDGCPPPRYPEDPTLSNDKLREQRKVYWAWFDTSFGRRRPCGSSRKPHRRTAASGGSTTVSPSRRMAIPSTFTSRQAASTTRAPSPTTSSSGASRTDSALSARCGQSRA